MMDNWFYVRSYGKKCPYCESEKIEKEMSGVQKVELEPKIYVDCYCNGCEKNWTENYNLAGYEKQT
jgi:3-deoxy-D-arabino-heptulosonate 7-phosphate (DAHP) synthase